MSNGMMHLMKKILAVVAALVAVVAFTACRPDPAIGVSTSTHDTPSTTYSYAFGLGDRGFGPRMQRSRHYCPDPWWGQDNWQYGAWTANDGQLSITVKRCNGPVYYQSAVVAYR